MRVADLHCDTALEIRGGADLRAGNPGGHVDLARLRAGGIGLQFFACFVPSVVPEGRAHAEARELLRAVGEAIAASPGDLEAVETAEGALAAAGAGRIAVIRSVENGHAIEQDLRKLERFRREGVRAMTLTHSKHLPWAASSGEEGGEDLGLTPFGREVVAAMNALGMIVDVSHVHDATFWAVVRITRRPIIASHSCARSLCPVPRNLEDDQIRAIADTGGLVGINFFPGFLDRAYAERLEAEAGDLFLAYDRIERENPDRPDLRIAGSRRLGAELQERMASTPVGIERIADHVEHVLGIAGEDHVAFGSDFDGVPDLPAGVRDCAAFPSIVEALRTRGLAERAIEKATWGNAIRVLRDTDR